MEDTETLGVEELFGQAIETPVEPPKRKRRKFRRYPRPPELNLDQRQALLDLQKHRCPICLEPLTLEEAVLDHSYRRGTARGLLHRSPCNTGLGMFKDSPTRLKNALAYLRNPPGKALGLCDSEKERVKG
jgi:Recombination endonuclease VII